MKQDRITLYDYNKDCYELLNQWMKAENACGKRILCKDENGYFIPAPQKEIKLFEQEKIYISEEEAIKNHHKEYLSMKYNEMIKDKNNWIVKEVITSQEYENRCTALDRMSGAIAVLFGQC